MTKIGCFIIVEKATRVIVIPGSLGHLAGPGLEINRKQLGTLSTTLPTSPLRRHN